MKLIAHRGLTNGPNSQLENKPSQINLAIREGFDVEIDVWYVHDKIYLGHDRPEYLVDFNFINKPQVWGHAKNYQALEYMLNNGIHCFWHENDERTLTSNGFIWTYPGKETTSKSVIVCLEKELTFSNKNIFGICGDYVKVWKTENSIMF
jgi:hypothetical protein